MIRSVIIFLVFLLVVYGLSHLHLGIGWNIGLPFGYYGKLNRVRSELHRFPDIEIVEEGLHRDMTLEDFGIKIFNGHRKAWLQFNTEGGRLTWELFSGAADLLVIDSHTRNQVYVLGADSPLSRGCGQPIRNYADVVQYLTRVLQFADQDQTPMRGGPASHTGRVLWMYRAD